MSNITISTESWSGMENLNRNLFVDDVDSLSLFGYKKVYCWFNISRLIIITNGACSLVSVLFAVNLMTNKVYFIYNYVKLFMN